MQQLWQNAQADEYLSQWKPFNSDVLHPRFIPLSFCTCWYQWGALQGSNTWHSVMGTVSWALEFWATALLTNMNCFTHILLDLWPIKSQECQMSLWELSSLSLTLHCSNMERTGFSNPHDETCSQSSCQEAISQHELTCMSQAQQIGWAHCLLQVLCDRMKHYCLNHVCLL